MCRFISLQYDATEDEIGAAASQHGIHVEWWPEAIRDYDETAAATGLARRAVGTTLTRARKRLVEGYREQEKDRHVAS